MKIFLMKIIYFLGYILNYINSQSLCSIGLECPTSFCCKNSKCVETTECKKDTNLVYIVVGCTAVFLLIITIIYYLISRKETIEAMNHYNFKLHESENNQGQKKS